MNIDKEREAFEVHMKRQFPFAALLLSKDENGEYLTQAERSAWEVWQARDALDEQKAGPKGEPVHQVFHSDGRWEDIDAEARANCEDHGKETRTLYAAPAPKGEPSGYPCKIIEADFDTGTVLLQMDGRFTASAGPKFLCDAAPVNEQDAALAEAQRNIAIAMLAKWCVAVRDNGTGWDDWDHHYKNAAYRPGPLREVIDAAIRKETGDD